ncbi:MAG: insulinase family protein, partial [Gammaproteobacteria bacterium]
LTMFSAIYRFRYCGLIALIAMISLSAGCQNPARPPATTQSEGPVEVIKSPNDPRAYHFETLPNGLKLLVISDAAADKSAAALTVFRGSFHDPKERPGLAHFLEHMLFIGTEKYPEPDGYFSFIETHGGSSNAYTAPDHTNYFFDIQPEFFGEGLDRFGQFFIAPLMDPAYVEREKNAVHSEYQMQYKADGWRGFTVQKQAMNPDHPFSQFSIGSLETLDGDVYSDLMTFFEEHYSADQMSAVILHREPLETLVPWVKALFSDVAGNDRGPIAIEADLIKPDSLPMTLKYQNLKDDYSVSYTFPTPDVRQHYRTKPAQYLASLIGHEGEGSLHAQLTQTGWITSLGAYNEPIDAENGVFFISIGLTPSGANHIDEITDIVFSYIDLLRSEGPQAWYYEEEATVSKLGFEFEEQSSAMSTVMSLASDLQYYPPEDINVAPYLMTAFDASLIDSYLSALRTDNVMITIADPSYEGPSIEPWFEVPYGIEQGIGRAPAAQSIKGGLTIPAPNPFLPSDLALKPGNDAQPRVVTDEEDLTLLLATDTEFGVPRAVTHVSIRSDRGLISLKDVVASNLYAYLVKDDLNTLGYPALLAGVSFEVATPPRGFRVTLGGYQDKQAVLLERVLETLTTLAIAEDRFTTLKEEFRRSLENSSKDRPYQQGFSQLTDTLLESSWPADAMMTELEQLTRPALAAWRNEYFSEVNVEGLMVGNVDEQDASAIRQTLREQLSLAPGTDRRPTVTQIKDRTDMKLEIDHDDAMMVIYAQNDDDSLTSRASSSLLVHLLRPKYFTSLRTEQQLGYVVTAIQAEYENQGGVGFVIQSPVASAQTLVDRTTQFLDWQREALTSLEAEAFSEAKAGLIAEILEKDKNLGSRAGRYWSDLDEGIMTFDGREQIAAAIDALSKAELMTFFEQVTEKIDDRPLFIWSQGKFAASEGEAEAAPAL